MQEQVKENSKVLLHCCCGICSGHPITYLKDLGYEPIAFFFNPNIQPESEYQKRLEAQKKICKELDCELIVDDYLPELYNEVTIGYENEPEKGKRCQRCFELRLLRTIQKAQDLGIEKYTTTITVSPHKDFDTITKIGKNLSNHFKIDYLELDFKKQDGFLKTNKIAKELNLYRQNYCGCVYSIKNKKDANGVESI